jgi:hypothetical protein
MGSALGFLPSESRGVLSLKIYLHTVRVLEHAATRLTRVELA